MLLRSLKQTLVFSVVALLCYGLFISCENPFSNNLGSKVDIEPPTVTEITPTPGAYIKGVTRFEGNASAYRELRSVQIRIINQDESKPDLIAWKDNVTVTFKEGGDDKNKSWFFDLNTVDFEGMDDGFLKIQFRANDKNDKADTLQLVYIVKNKPSVVKVTTPDSAKLGTDDAKILTNTELRGQIIDRRGIKPGYPMIKIWPATMAEPAGNNTNWGWVKLFLSDIDDTENYIYTDRAERQVVRTASFVFRLSEYTINATTREVVYTMPYKPLPSNITYNFRILSSDTFFESDKDAVHEDDSGRSIYLWPREPIAADDEVEAVGYYPDDPSGTENNGLYHSMVLVSSNEPVIINLDNSDEVGGVPVVDLPSPNIYMIEPPFRKTVKTGQSVFRLRILATHAQEEIQSASLRWEHISAAWGTRGATVAWTGAGGNTGTWKNGLDHLEGKYFVYTGQAGSENTGFVSSTEPYYLYVTVTSTGGIEAKQTYTLYLDGSGPTVKILSVMGAYSQPEGDGTKDGNSSGYVNDNAYTVNGNIQVAVERSAPLGIAQRNGVDSVKWIVEPASLGAPGATGTTLEKLRNYYSTPNAANLAFYNNIVEDTTNGMSGIIKSPISGATLEVDSRYHLKFNTVKGTVAANEWDKQNLWLYIIAEDTVQNLGFTLQKLYVDDATDKPTLEVPGLTATTIKVDGVDTPTGFNGPDSLLLANNAERKNILSIRDGIDLTIKDDDGVSLGGTVGGVTRTNGITVTLTNLNVTPSVNRTITVTRAMMTSGTDNYETNSSKEWIGSLSQQVMATALYGGTNNTNLRDGFYSIAIAVQDNRFVKVAINGTRPGDVPTQVTSDPATQTYYFAVQSRNPIMTISSPIAGTTVNNANTSITGTVTGPFRLSSLNITFTPNVITDGSYSDNPVTMPVTLTTPTYDNTTNTYTYTWTYPNVNFAPNFDFNTAERTVKVEATDVMGNSDSKEVAVRVDNEPPEITLAEFNYNRPKQIRDGYVEPQYVVNGKVPIKINVYDQGGIGRDGTNNTGSNARISWWVQLSTAAAPTWTNTANAPSTTNGTAFPTGTNGNGARFAYNAGGNEYSINLTTGGVTTTDTSAITTVLTQGGRYTLWVIAEDANNNKSPAKNLAEFIVDQNSDFPVLDEGLLSPYDTEIINTQNTPLKITGFVSDDDGFNSASVKFNNATTTNRYIEIRFPTSVSATNVITWGAWIPLSNANATLNLGAGGEIEFSYTPPTATTNYPNASNYLTTDGTKYYQIRVVDEDTAGGNASGKNPATPAPTVATTLTSALKIFPSAGTALANAYSFGIKNNNPQIFFNRFDPDSTHPGSNINNPAPNTRIVYNGRPIYRLADQLTTDLTGYVAESLFKSVSVTYSSGTTVSKAFTVTSTGNNHTWNITTGADSITEYLNNWFAAGANGMHIITIEATDTVNNIVRVEWPFYKDNTPPAVNASLSDVIKYDTGTVPKILGTFSDDVSPINTTYQARFYNNPASKGTYSTYPATDRSGTTAKWSLDVPLATLTDGVCYFEILVGDTVGNTGTATEFSFILDRAAPLVSSADLMWVKGDGITGTLAGVYTSLTAYTNNEVANGTRYFQSSTIDNPADKGLSVGSIVKIDGVDRYVLSISSNGTGAALRYRIKVSAGLTGADATTVYPPSANAAISDRTVTVVTARMEEFMRVFSAATLTPADTVAFTLRGLVYERNLTDLTANINPGSGSNPISVELKDTVVANTLAKWIADGASGFYPSETASFRITRANATDRNSHNPSDIFTNSNNDLDHLYVWEFEVTRGNFNSLLTSLGTDGTVRSVTVAAKDIAQRNSTRENWRFYLDKTPPKVEFLNANTAYFETLNLQGTITDDTNVKSLEFTLAKYVHGDEPYSDGSWRYYDGTGWNITDLANAAPNSWVDLLGSDHTIGKSVGWTLSSTTLNGNSFYGNPLQTDGHYRIDLRFKDYSLSAVPASAGNPDTTFTTFYIDKADPAITWGAEPKEFYKSSDLTFTLNASDINSIETPTAVVRTQGATSGGTPVTVNVTTDPTGTTPQNAFTVGPITSGITTGGRYTLILTVTDGAGRVAVTNNTIDFLVDDTEPAIALTPDTTNAIVGRVQFQGTFTKATNLSPVTRVAFAVGGTVPSATADMTVSQLQTAGWVFSAMGGALLKDGNQLMVIDQGLATAKMTLFDTRDFDGTGYLVNKANRTITFDGKTITDAETYQLPLHFLAIDGAGNVKTTTITYLVYPEGDIPVVSEINNPDPKSAEVERLMNGRIRISGQAVDNVRVRNVWFRVINQEPGSTSDGGYGGLNEPMRLNIPAWNTETWDQIGSTMQTPQNQTLYGATEATPGWYMARGGGSRSASWYEYINSDGELDPSGAATSRRIEIQVIAEDTRWIDSLKSGEGDWDPNKGWISRNANKVTATVVQTAPRFEDEWVRLGGSNDSFPPASGWGTVANTNVSQRAAYAITVKHEVGVGAIRWIRSDRTINLLDSADSYNSSDSAGSYLGNLNGMNNTTTPTGDGIAVKAEPKRTLKNSVTDASGKTFMIWKPDAALDAIVGASENKQFTIFTATTATLTLGGGELMERTAEGVFEWIVVVDLRTTLISYPDYSTTWATTPAADRQNPADGKWGSVSDRFGLNFSASEVSKSVPLTASHAAVIPVDNKPPEGRYTHTTNVVGTAATFGGEAGDDGIVSGISRVVLWFSRNENGTSPVMWDEKKGTTPAFATGTVPAGIVNWPSGMSYPNTDYTGGTGNRSSIIIDRNDPLGSQPHHGHQLQMGLAASGAGLGYNWYVTLNSNLMESGKVYAHFVVFDKADNARYYSQKLMILNGKPSIARVKLATDIRGGEGLGLAGSFNNGATANLVNGARTAAGTTNSGEGVITNTGNLMNFAAGTGARPSVLNTIKNRFADRVTGISGTSSDASVGISDEIAINTDRLNEYNVVYHDSFAVRNNLLAMKVETLIPQLSGSSKPRNFRLEYVQNATKINGRNAMVDASTGIRAGRMYIIENPGDQFYWGLLGVQGETPRRGTAFIALENASDANIPAGTYTAPGIPAPSVWELNSNYYTNADSLNRTVPTALRLDDVVYPGSNNTNENANIGTYAEFAYQSGAFGGTDGIKDFNPIVDTDFAADFRPLAYPFPSVISGTQDPHVGHSLFILRVFDGLESDLFGDFALLAIRVNNNDKTKPYAQLYDLNPKAEGVDNNPDKAQALSPGASIGLNRVKGGLYNEGTTALIEKSGHIEPRTGTSLTSSNMGGAESADTASMQKPFANGAYFDVDTVSGKVIVRGYAEDNQRIGTVTLQFWSTAATPAQLGGDVLILDTAATINNPPTSPAKLPVVGFMQAASGLAANVSFTEALDLNRHRVEWAYVWDSETVSGTPVGDISIRVIAHNINTTRAPSERIPFSGLTGQNRTTYDYFNPTFPSAASPASRDSFYRYNDIRVNIRPYITGFVRNKAEFAHDTRSRQGRYMFAQGEVVVIKGFNLGGDGYSPTITLPPNGGTAITGTIGANNGQVSADNVDNNVTAFGLPSNARNRYRIFTVPNNAVTGHGMVTYAIRNGAAATPLYRAVNTDDRRFTTTDAAVRRPTVIQPWNIEFTPGKDGESNLWDDFTAVHIWRSGTTNTGNADHDLFASSDNWVIMNPAMSIEPSNGVLYASHNEGGIPGSTDAASANAGLLRGSANNANTVTSYMRFRDPMIQSDVYRSPGGNGIAADTWYVTSIIGASASTRGGQSWESFGGIYIRGPDGRPVDLSYNNNGNINTTNNFYHAESTWYNAGSFSPTGPTRTIPNYTPYTDQFMNPHIITSINNQVNTTYYEHIHVSYYDTKDGSIKYRYNRRGQAGIQDNATNGSNDIGDNMTTVGNAAYIPKAWTNLDGGVDVDDTDAATHTTPTLGGNIAENARVVRWNTSIAGTKSARGEINAGEHNAIAVTSQGFPVIAYYDATNSRLKLAVSGSATPVLANTWVIRDFVIPGPNQVGTGEFVSIAIDTRITTPANPNLNTIHIACMNSDGNLVYVRGKITPPTVPVAAANQNQTSAGVLTDVTVQVVDKIGTVGRWCKISLDVNGDPWIAYQDAGNNNSRDGVKVAYLNKDLFIKGHTYFADEDLDMYGESVAGWETMHVPTQFPVLNPVTGTGEHGRIGLECYPTRNYTGTLNPATRFWGAAVSYLSSGGTTGNKYRIAYYVK
jgi:hypothetical protein